MPVAPNYRPPVNDEWIAKTTKEIDRILTDEPMSPQEAKSRAAKRMSSCGSYLRLEVRTDERPTYPDMKIVGWRYNLAGWASARMDVREDDQGLYLVVKLSEYTKPSLVALPHQEEPDEGDDEVGDAYYDKDDEEY